MSVQVVVTAVFATVIAQLLLSDNPSKADERTDIAVQTALDIGQAIGAATACPEVSRPRIKILTDRFASAVSTFGDNRDTARSINGAFDQGLVFGGQAVAARKIRCDAAVRDLADWEAGNLSLVLAVPSPPSLMPATAPLVPTPAAPPPIVVTNPPPALPLPVFMVATPSVPVTAAAVPPPVVNTHNIQGMTDREIRFGMVAPFSGPTKELGRQMKLGIETAFNAINDAGGINGRKVTLLTADDGYDPARTGEAMKQLYETEKIFGFIGNVGTPTTIVERMLLRWLAPLTFVALALFSSSAAGMGVPPPRVPVRVVDVRGAAAILSRGAAVLDARDAAAFAQGHLPGAQM